MPKYRVEFTVVNPVLVAPDKKEAVKGLPHVECITCSRNFNLDRPSRFPIDIEFYGDYYRTKSIGTSFSSNDRVIGRWIEIRTTEVELAKLLVKAKAAGHRWKIRKEVL